MASTVAPAPEPSSNSFARVAGVFFSPKQTFDSIAQRPTWLLPVILSILVSLCLFGVLGSRVGWQRLVERNMQSNPITARQMDQLSPEQRQNSINLQVKIFPYAFLGGSVVGPFLFTVLLAAIFLGLFNLLYGAKVDFKTSLGVVAYASLPRILYALVGILVVFLKDPSQVDLQNLVASNPGALMPSETAAWIVALARQFDLFTFWVILLLAIGYSAATRKKVSTGGAFAGIVGIWLIPVIIQVGIAAAFS